MRNTKAYLCYTKDKILSLIQSEETGKQSSFISRIRVMIEFDSW